MFIDLNTSSKIYGTYLKTVCVLRSKNSMCEISNGAIERKTYLVETRRGGEGVVPNTYKIKNLHWFTCTHPHWQTQTNSWIKIESDSYTPRNRKLTPALRERGNIVSHAKYRDALLPEKCELGGIGGAKCDESVCVCVRYIWNRIQHISKILANTQANETETETETEREFSERQNGRPIKEENKSKPNKPLYFHLIDLTCRKHTRPQSHTK